MSKIINHIRLIFLSYFLRARQAMIQEQPHYISNEPPPEPQAPLKEKKPRGERKKEHYGSLYYLDNLLDCLDDYFEYLKLFRRHDPDTYSYYAKVGGTTVTDKQLLLELGGLPYTWRQGERPSFAFLHFIEQPEENKALPNFIYFKKLANPYYIEKTSDTIYEVCCFYADKRDKEKRYLGQFFMGVDDKCQMRLLKQKSTKFKTIPHKKGAPSRFYYQAWDTCTYLKYVIDEGRKQGKKITEFDLAKDYFTMLANGYQNANSGILVRCAKESLNAAFSIDMLRTPYFFKDRDKTSVSASGKRKKIFHIVRGHSRVNRFGITRNVKTHFRGERKFKWNGYQVQVSMPGWNHIDFSQFDLPGAVVDEGEITDKNMVTMGKLGGYVAEKMSA